MNQIIKKINYRYIYSSYKNINYLGFGNERPEEVIYREQRRQKREMELEIIKNNLEKNNKEINKLKEDFKEYTRKQNELLELISKN